MSGITPVVDTKRTTVGGTFDLDQLQNIPTARDPWMIIYMAPGIQLGGTNVGGSSSGSQPAISSRGTTANVQWNMEGGATTDLQSNTSASYYNFDALEQLQVINGGGDVSVQSSGVSINLITKSGSNVFKGSGTGTLTNDAMQFQNVDAELFSRGTGGFLSGAPLNRVTNITGEYGGPIIRNKLWFWGNADHQDINAAVLNYYDASKGGNCAGLRRRAAPRHHQPADHVRQPGRGPGLPSQRQDSDLPRRREAELHAEQRAQVPVPDPG